NQGWQVGAIVMKSHANKSGAPPFAWNEPYTRRVRCLPGGEQLQASDDSRTIQFPTSQTTSAYEPACSEPACSEPACTPLLTRTLTSTRRFRERPLASELSA